MIFQCGYGGGVDKAGQRIDLKATYVGHSKMEKRWSNDIAWGCATLSTKFEGFQSLGSGCLWHHDVLAFCRLRNNGCSHPMGHEAPTRQSRCATTRSSTIPNLKPS